MRKICRLLEIGLLLMVGLGACEKEGVEGEIVIRFSLGDGGYEARGAGLEKAEAETVVVALGGVVHMYATLEEEETEGTLGTNGTIGTTGAESGLRAAGDEAMEMGTIIVIAAYDENGDYVTKAEYEVTDTSGGIKPTDASGRGIIITATGDYTFVAYSLNEKESFSYSGSMGPYSADNPDHDPLWGSSLKVTVSAGMNKVPIEMRHVFSKVRIKATSEELAGKPAISNVSASLIGYQAVILYGVPTKGVAENQTFENFPSTPATTAYSVQRVVYAGNEDITTIKINSATIGGTTHMGSVARFNHKLLPGRSYTLTVKFDELVWARSNVYWDDTAEQLTFVPANGTTDNQGYQGVFFKWGSLVGISPAQVGGSDAFSGSTPLYIPVVHASTWKATDGNSTGSDTDIDVSVRHNYTVWSEASYIDDTEGDIPYMDPSQGGIGTDRSNTWLIDAERNNFETYKGLRGDICQYIGATTTDVNLKGYRMPASYEYGTHDVTSWGTPNANGWQKHTNDFTTETNGAGYPNGRADLLSNVESANFDPSENSHAANTVVFGSAINTTMGDAVFPASGLRGVSDGALRSVGLVGMYWSGTTYTNDKHQYNLEFTDAHVKADDYSRRSYGFPVRCVKN